MLEINVSRLAPADIILIEIGNEEQKNIRNSNYYHVNINTNNNKTLTMILIIREFNKINIYQINSYDNNNSNN